MPSSEHSSNDLSKDIQRCTRLSVASSTRLTYSSGEKRFIEFIHLFKRTTVEQCLPAREALLTGFAAFLSRSIKYPSIKIYLAAVRHFHVRHGFRVKFAKNGTSSVSFA